MKKVWFGCHSAMYKHRNLTSHFSCLGPSFLICKIKVLNWLTSKSHPAPASWDSVMTAAFQSGPYDHLDFEEVACLSQYHERLPGKSWVKTFYSVLKPPYPSAPLYPWRYIGEHGPRKNLAPILYKCVCVCVCVYTHIFMYRLVAWLLIELFHLFCLQN